MTDRQLSIGQYILDNEAIPGDIDILIMNASFGTCINIYGKVDKIIIDDSDEDIVIQARGRYRDDLNMLYRKDKNASDVDYIIENWLNRDLFVSADGECAAAADTKRARTAEARAQRERKNPSMNTRMGNEAVNGLAWTARGSSERDAGAQIIEEPLHGEITNSGLIPGVLGGGMNDFSVSVAKLKFKPFDLKRLKDSVVIDMDAGIII